MSGGRHLPDDWFPWALPDNVVLEEGVDLWSSVSLLKYRSRRPRGLRIGARSGVWAGTMFDIGPNGEVDIGATCMFGEVTFCTDQRIVIGDHCLLARGTVLADGPFAAPSWDEASSSRPPETVIVVEDGAWIGQHCVLLPGAHIGADAIVGMKTVVDFPVPPSAIVAGDPPRVIGDTRG